MLVVHGAWLPSARLALWAERPQWTDPSVPAAEAPAPPARAGRRRRRLPHPYAATAEELATALHSRAASSAAHATGTLALRLPTAARSPLPAPESGGQPPATTDPVSVQEWLVPTLEYEVDDALPLLEHLRDVAEVAAVPEVTGEDSADSTPTSGATLRHLGEVARFARELVARGRVLPTVESTPTARKTHLACWRPVLTGADAAWARSLCLALPPAGWAHLTGERDGPVTVVGAALDQLVDAAARAALPATALTRDRRRGAAAAWLRALAGRRRRFPAEPTSATTLARDLDHWQRDAVGGAVRGCFQLIEPEENDQWRLRFGLQDADEPSLVVDAERIWQSSGALRALARRIDSPQETFLSELGRASRLFPELEPALRTSQPSHVDFDVEAAHHFLTERAPVLAATGFGVLLPSWWSRPQAALGVRATARTPAQPGTVSGGAGIDQTGLVDFEWQLALGDSTLTEEELAELTALKAPLVRLRGQWVHVDPNRLAAGAALLAEQHTEQLSVPELLRVAAGEVEGPGGLPVTGVSASGWLEDLLTGAAEQRLTRAEEPDGFAGSLRPYQLRGLAWLDFLQRVGLGGILADDMGLGKTVQLLALLAADPPQAGPTLLVCPMSLVGNWQREAARFAPGLRVHVHHGAERARGEEFTAAVTAADLVLTTYSLLARDGAELREVTWHRVVADEAQAVKNAATRQASALRALPARHRIAVTGTPVENRLADLWSLMEFANPGLLGPAATFKKRYAEPVERHGDAQAAARLQRLTGPFILRRVKTDRSIISDLPEKLEMEVLCNLTTEQATLYQAVVDDMLDRIENSTGIERRGLVLATMTKLKQICNHPTQLLRDSTRLTGRSGKLARLEEILEEVLSAGEKALLFTQYAGFGGMLRDHLSARFGRQVAFLHGGVGKQDRDDLVARFQSDAAGAPSLFVLSLKAGGTGLTLTAANHVVHVDRWWNPAVEDQATDRAFRIGQRRAVQVRKLVCAGTVEEKVAGLLRDKRGLAERVVGTGEQWLTELSTDQLRELVTLDQGAVVE